KQAGQRLADEVKDKTGFLTDLGRHEMSQRKGPDTAPAPDLTDVQIAADGTTATGKSVSHQADGGDLSREVQFQKIDGSWFISSIIIF
ncbi:MAG TPA: hypothetical protein VHY37_05015, partial [Tepidisphaeraceae bacterium]|nr:hypothetical protein [Tepidisphaeraceae bacterium]